MPVEAVLDNPDVALRKLSDKEFRLQGPSSAELFRTGSTDYFDAYVDLPGRPENPGCRYEVDALRYTRDLPSTVYARVVADDEHGGLYLQYWLFYYFNDWNNRHEADWELIQLYFGASSPEEALTQEPVSIGLSQHRTGEVAAWSDSKLKRIGSHPIVHVAVGSHANYFSPGLYLGRGEDGRGMGCDEASFPHRRVMPIVTLLPPVVRGADDPFAWISYKGYWGEVGGHASEGSTALATKQTWLRPAAWHAGLHRSSISLPSGDGIGPDAARAFCDTISFGASILLPVFKKLPPLSFLSIGLVSAGAFGFFATTGYLAPALRSIRRANWRRNVFQSALGTYRSHPEVFLSIGLLAFPLRLALSHVWDLVPKSVEFDLSLPLLGKAPLYLAEALSFGGLDAAVSSLAVVSVTILVVSVLSGRLAANRSPVAGLFAALLSRFVAILVIAALYLSVIGTPLALRLAIRWAFLEEAVLAGGATWRSAFGWSSAIADRATYRAAGVLLVLGVSAVLVPPVSGMVLLVSLKSLPITYVNIGASILYAALVPLYALVRSHLYIKMSGGAVREEQPPHEATANA